MRVFVCLDESKGMLFNRRRQSQDALVRKDMMASLQGGKLWMNAYSAGQFQQMADELCIAEDFLDKAGADDSCFVENVPLRPYVNRITELVVYGWNRRYPADVYLDLALQDWEAAEQRELAGSSHDRITRTRYIRKVSSERYHQKDIIRRKSMRRPKRERL